MIELIFKKYFWVLTGLTTAVLALLVALTANAWVAGKIRAAAPSAVRMPVAPPPVDPIMVLRAPVSGLAHLLDSRRYLNADPPPKPEPIETTEVETKEDGADEAGTEEEIPISDLNIQLLGTLVSPDSRFSMATIKAGNVSKLVQEGMEIESGVRVTHIDKRFILVSQGDHTERIRLWAEARPPAGRPGYPSTRGRTPYRPPITRPGSRPISHLNRPPRNTTDYSKGVAKSGEWEYKIDRSMLEGELNDLTKLGMQARVVPNYVGGKYRGFKLVGVRPNSLYRAIGIRSGDVVQRINGMEIDSPNKALQLFEKLRTSRKINLDIQRNGINRTLFYTVQ